MKILKIVITLFIFSVFSYKSIADPGDSRIQLTGDAFSQGKTQSFSVKQLESMFTLVTIDLYNPWEKKTDKYTGFWMTDLIQKLAKPELKKLRLKAIDNYQVEFTENDWTKFKILVVTKVNNEYQSVRNKGPMRLIYTDYDPANVEHELNLTKWMWMIKKIEFH